MFRRTTVLLSAGLLLSPLAVTAQATDDIPITTSSDAARQAFVQGRALVDVGRNDEAREALRKAVGLDARFAYAWVNLANVAQSPGEFREATKEASRSTDGKSEGEKLLVAVNETFLTADTDRRIELSEQLVEAYPRSPRAWLTRGFALQSVDRHDDARQSFAKAVELESDLYAAHAALGFSYLFNEPRSPEKAVTYMEKCVELSPGEAKAHEALGDGYRALGDLVGAREAYSKALELDPKLSVASLKKGHVNSFLSHFEEARSDYDAGVDGAVGPNRIAFANYRAFVHVHADRPGDAIRELRQIAADAGRSDLDPNDRYGVQVFTLTNAAAIALHHRMNQEAKEILDERARLMIGESERLADPDFTRRQQANIQLWNARASLAWGDLEQARRDLQTHHELLEPDRDPTRLQGYHLVQGLISLEEGDAQGAVIHLREADLEDQYAKYHLALALEAAGRATEAERLFGEVADFHFNSVDYALVRRDAMKKKG